MPQHFFCLPPVIFPGHSNIYAAVVINEIFPKPSDAANQWIELYNTETDTVSLNQWKIENISNGGKSYIIAASGSIPGKGFYLINRSQSAIPLSIQGDTIKLSDPNNTVVDSQTYPSTLGFNTSMGRSPDGGAGMTVCDVPTPEKPNNCPVPTPTSTPLPPTNTPVPTATPVPAPPAAADTLVPVSNQNTLSPGVSFQPPSNVEVPGAAGVPSPSPTPTTPADSLKIEVPKSIIVSKTLAVQVLIVTVAWVLIAVTAIVRKKFKNRPH